MARGAPSLGGSGGAVSVVGCVRGLDLCPRFGTPAAGQLSGSLSQAHGLRWPRLLPEGRRRTWLKDAVPLCPPRGPPCTLGSSGQVRQVPVKVAWSHRGCVWRRCWVGSAGLIQRGGVSKGHVRVGGAKERCPRPAPLPGTVPGQPPFAVRPEGVPMSPRWRQLDLCPTSCWWV